MHIKHILLATLTILFISSVALAYPTIGARVSFYPEDPHHRMVTFHIRNNTQHEIDGYFYKIQLFNRHNEEIFNKGRPFEGHKNIYLMPGQISEQKIAVETQGPAVRATVKVILYSSNSEGYLFIR